MFIENQPIMRVKELDDAGLSVHKFLNICNDNRCFVCKDGKSYKPIGCVASAYARQVKGYVMGDIYIDPEFASDFLHGNEYIVTVAKWCAIDGAIELIVS